MKEFTIADLSERSIFSRAFGFRFIVEAKVEECAIIFGGGADIFRMSVVL